MDDFYKLKELAQNFCILYAEDEPELRDGISKYLRKFFKRVDVANNGEEGLKKYNLSDYDIVLSDIMMPKMNGLEMCKEIKAIKEDQEIIVLSAYSDSEYLFEAIKIGLSGYVLKPVNFNQLNSVLFDSLQKITKFKENERYHTHLEKLVDERSSQLLHLEKEKIVNFEETLFALVELIESRDTYTGGHTQRVANYCKMIAQDMEFSDNECDLIYRAGILHDIGKVATPDTVLLKPGSLNSFEYELIKEHVKVGTVLLNKIPMYKELSDIIRYHHERFDGQGYPDGLQGDEIPPLSRIMIVADSFDAMTTSRVYKARKNVYEAIEELQSLSGKQFDPEVVLYAVKVFRDIDLDHSINQKPTTKLEEQRFAYFYIDQLTHLHNRDYLENVLTHRESNKFIYNYAYGVYLHNFTNFNKKNGWNKGDELLKAFAKELSGLFPKALTFRLFGDDFMVLNVEAIEFPSNKDFLCIKNTVVTMSHKYIDIRDKVIDISDLEMML